MPRELLEKVLSTQTFNQGFATTEYLAASIVDQASASTTVTRCRRRTDLDFEAQALRLPVFRLMKFRSLPRDLFLTYYRGYSAGYYSYIWSEVLDADTVDWFHENGGLLVENGDHFRQSLLSQGGSKDAMGLYRSFTGREAQILPLLERRGLN